MRQRYFQTDREKRLHKEAERKRDRETKKEKEKLRKKKVKPSNGKLGYKKLYISNMVVTGKILLNKLISVEEGNKLINKYGFMWINEEYSPILSKRIELRKEKKLSVHGKIKQPYVSIWTSGAINIVGVKSMKEAKQVYDIVLSDLKKVCPKKLKLNPKLNELY